MVRRAMKSGEDAVGASRSDALVQGGMWANPYGEVPGHLLPPQGAVGARGGASPGALAARPRVRPGGFNGGAAPAAHTARTSWFAPARRISREKLAERHGCRGQEPPRVAGG